jgi:ABC-type amino acid transport system permease subunit
MMIKKTLAAVVAASLVGAPIVAQAAAAQAARTGSPVEEGENIQGGWFIPALAIIAIILGIVVLIDDGDDLPTSP